MIIITYATRFTSSIRRETTRRVNMKCISRQKDRYFVKKQWMSNENTIGNVFNRFRRHRTGNLRNLQRLSCRFVERERERERERACYYARCKCRLANRKEYWVKIKWKRDGLRCCSYINKCIFRSVFFAPFPPNLNIYNVASKYRSMKKWRPYFHAKLTLE